MLDKMQRYPATTLAAVVALAAIAAGAALFLGSDDAGTQRLGLLLALIGPMATTILSANRAEAGTHAARRADEGVRAAVEAGEQTTPAALVALTKLLEASDRIESAATRAEHAADVVTNGHLEGQG